MDEKKTNTYFISTDYGKFQIEAAELQTEYDEKRNFTYVLAFDERGQACGYFDRVGWWTVVANAKIQLPGQGAIDINEYSEYFRTHYEAMRERCDEWKKTLTR